MKVASAPPTSLQSSLPRPLSAPAVDAPLDQLAKTASSSPLVSRADVISCAVGAAAIAVIADVALSTLGVGPLSMSNTMLASAAAVGGAVGGLLALKGSKDIQILGLPAKTAAGWVGWEPTIPAPQAKKEYDQLRGSVTRALESLSNKADSNAMMRMDMQLAQASGSLSVPRTDRTFLEGLSSYAPQNEQDRISFFEPILRLLEQGNSLEPVSLKPACLLAARENLVRGQQGGAGDLAYLKAACHHLGTNGAFPKAVQQKLTAFPQNQVYDNTQRMWQARPIAAQVEEQIAKLQSLS